jgi:amino acid transporter
MAEKSGLIVPCPMNCRYARGKLDEMWIMRLNTSQFDIPGFGCGLTLLLFFWVLGAVGLGWVVKSFLFLVVFIVLAPVIGFFGLRWWLQRNLIQDKCPVCSYEFTGLNQAQLNCPSCGEPLQIEGGHFKRITPPGTIDVQAVEVSVQQIED